MLVRWCRPRPLIRNHPTPTTSKQSQVMTGPAIFFRRSRHVAVQARLTSTEDLGKLVRVVAAQEWWKSAWGSGVHGGRA